MGFLFITKYLAGDITGLSKELQIELLAFVIVTIATIIDLVFGIRRAKRLKITRTSYGFRCTVSKILQYYSALLFAFMLDILASIVETVDLPYFTFFLAIFLVYIEFKSVRENVSDKKGVKQHNKDLRDILNLIVNKGKGLENIVQQLDEQIKKEEEEKIHGKS